jgi:twitching motility protein PilT
MAMEILPERHRREWEATNDTDFCYQFEKLARFRTNVYRDLHGPGMAMRLIPLQLMTVDDLGLAQPIRDLAMLSKGIVLFTGPTGCGKTTTQAALLHYANERRRDHIITIEDPIEFLHESVNCIITQREAGTHTESFKRALRAGLREDPDIMLVGEMRDLETMALTIECAETGHLVFATVHTSTASSTVDRIIDQFPPDRQEQIRVMLANTLKCIITQALCKRKDKGRVAAFEILYVHSAVANLIREKKTYQLPSVIQTGKKYGMMAMNESLMGLFEKDMIALDEAYYKSVDKQDMNERVNNHLLSRVLAGEMTPFESLEKSYFKPRMLEKLREGGFAKALQKIDMSQFDQTDFVTG